VTKKFKLARHVEEKADNGGYVDDVHDVDDVTS
jgi:hypothetical protein